MCESYASILINAEEAAHSHKCTRVRTFARLTHTCKHQHRLAIGEGRARKREFLQMCIKIHANVMVANYRSMKQNIKKTTQQTAQQINMKRNKKLNKTNETIFDYLSVCVFYSQHTHTHAFFRFV